MPLSTTALLALTTEQIDIIGESARLLSLGRSDDLRIGGPLWEQIRFNADFCRSAMDCDALRDDQWDRIKGFVPGGTKGKRDPRTNNRLLLLDALLWMARSGGRWRDLPARLGEYSEAALLSLDRNGACSMTCWRSWHAKPIWNG